LKKCEKHVSGFQPGSKVPLLEDETDHKKRGKGDIGKSKCSVDSLGNLVDLMIDDEDKSKDQIMYISID
jgi:hypothetical protein